MDDQLLEFLACEADKADDIERHAHDRVWEYFPREYDDEYEFEFEFECYYDLIGDD